MRSIRLWFTFQPSFRSIPVIRGDPYRPYTDASSTIRPVSGPSSSRTRAVYRCTDRGSLPEVVGDAAHIFDPDRDDEMDGAMRWLLEGRNAHAAMIERGHARAALFNWDRTAELTLRAYEHALRR
jgi:hypothetical protein